MLKTDIIAFFSAEHFFRLKTEEKQKEKFESLQSEFNNEFPDYEGDYSALFQVLIDYHKEQQKARKARQLAKARIKAALPVAAGCDKATDHIKVLPKGKYVLTCAQNNTYIDETALKCLLTFCEVNNARLLVARITYNKNGFAQPDINNDLWYDEKIKPYLVQGHISLDDKAHFLADSNVIPTAKNPLSGFDSATQAGIHVIIPHVKIALEVVAALKNSPVKIMASTGAVTKRNYIMRKAGATAALSHNIGALLVDIAKSEAIIRQLEIMPECDYFYDYDKIYFANGSHRKVELGEIQALQPGDIHAEKMTSENLDSIKGLLADLKPDYLIAHDLLDFSTQNHHNIKDCTHQHKQALLGNTVEKDIMIMTNIIDELLDTVICYNENGRLIVVESNHDLALLTWLKNADFKQDSVNAIVYLKCMLALYDAQTRGTDLNMLEWAYTHIGSGVYDTELIVFNRVDESCIIAGVEMGAHGHNGANGSKGTPKQFRKLGIPINTGHTHSPSIYGKVYTAGVSASLEMGYNVGASSWAIAHIVTYENGQRQIIFR